MPSLRRPPDNPIDYAGHGQWRRRRNPLRRNQNGYANRVASQRTTQWTPIQPHEQNDPYLITDLVDGALHSRIAENTPLTDELISDLVLPYYYGPPSSRDVVYAHPEEHAIRYRYETYPHASPDEIQHVAAERATMRANLSASSVDASREQINVGNYTAYLMSQLRRVERLIVERESEITPFIRDLRFLRQNPAQFQRIERLAREAEALRNELTSLEEQTRQLPQDDFDPDEVLQNHAVRLIRSHPLRPYAMALLHDNGFRDTYEEHQHRVIARPATEDNLPDIDRPWLESDSPTLPPRRIRRRVVHPWDDSNALRPQENAARRRRYRSPSPGSGGTIHQFSLPRY